MFFITIQNHLCSHFTHLFKICGDGSDAIQDKLFPLSFIVRNDADVFTNYQFGGLDFPQQHRQVIFHQVNTGFAFVYEFLFNLMHHFVVEGIPDGQEQQIPKSSL